MTSGEYLKQLEKYLRKLPQSDYEDAMEYFTEYFADAGPENEQAVIKELGTPKQAAAELMRNLLDKKVDEREAMEKEEKQKEKKKTTGANVVWIAILALFAAPIGAPILISILISRYALILSRSCAKNPGFFCYIFFPPYSSLQTIMERMMPSVMPRIRSSSAGKSAPLVNFIST